MVVLWVGVLKRSLVFFARHSQKKLQETQFDNTHKTPTSWVFLGGCFETLKQSFRFFAWQKNMQGTRFALPPGFFGWGFQTPSLWEGEVFL